MKAVKTNPAKSRSFEGIVEIGQVRLIGAACLPEKAKVRVILFEAPIQQVPRIASPRLAHPEEAADFRMEVEKHHPNA